MTTKSNKAVVSRDYEEVYNKRNISLVDELVSPTFYNHNASIQVRGIEGIKRGMQAQFEAFPDIHTVIEDLIAEGDKVVVRARDRFTQQRDGKAVELYRGHLTLYHVDLYRLRPSEVDDLGLDQLGDGAGVMAVEWADRMPRSIEDAVGVRIEDLGDDRRRITVSTRSGSSVLPS